MVCSNCGAKWPCEPCYLKAERAAIENEREIEEPNPYHGNDQEGADDQ